MRYSYKLLMTTIMACICFVAPAKDLQVSIKIINFEAKKTSEQLGDELYFGINEYSNKKISSYTRMPAFPFYWKSKNINKLKDQILWHEKIQDGEAIQLIISLLEHDLPPWNLDDHLGTIKLVLRNQHGKIFYKWSVPNIKEQNDTIAIAARKGSFVLKGDNSEYNVQLNVIAGN